MVMYAIYFRHDSHMRANVPTRLLWAMRFLYSSGDLLGYQILQTGDEIEVPFSSSTQASFVCATTSSLVSFFSVDPKLSMTGSIASP